MILEPDLETGNTPIGGVCVSIPAAVVFGNSFHFVTAYYLCLFHQSGNRLETTLETGSKKHFGNYFGNYFGRFGNYLETDSTGKIADLLLDNLLTQKKGGELK